MSSKFCSSLFFTIEVEIFQILNNQDEFCFFKNKNKFRLEGESEGINRGSFFFKLAPHTLTLVLFNSLTNAYEKLGDYYMSDAMADQRTDTEGFR